MITDSSLIFCGLLWFVCGTWQHTITPKANCRKSLGMASGDIPDEQITVSSVYDNDFSNYGSQRARLNLTSWPPGFRADPNQAGRWIKIDLEREMVITAISTQGYGDDSIQEWITKYMIMYSNGGDYSYFKDLNGDLKTFTGNKDANSIQRNDVPLPAVASSVMIMEISSHNNFAMRMELYGCEPGYYFVVWLMLSEFNCKTTYLDRKSLEYQLMVDDVVLESTHALANTPGFLSAKLARFSAQTEGTETKLSAEVKIFCIEASVHDITAALTNYIKKSGGLFDPNFIKLQYSLDYTCRPPDVHVDLQKMYTNATRVTTVDLLVVRGEVGIRCNTSSSLLLSWESNEIEEPNGLFMMSDRLAIASLNLTIEPGRLKVGLYFIRLIAEMTKEEGALNYDYGFLRVVLPDLVAKVRGVNKAVKGTGNIILDATDSYDPDNSAAQEQGMAFTWLCRRENEEFSNMETLPIDSSLGRAKVLGGCFGYGVGKMNTTEPLLEINMNKIGSKSTYVFKLIVEKENRTSVAYHTLRVESSIEFSIRCKINCGQKVTANKRMIIESTCRGLSCQNVQQYNWTLYRLNQEAYNETWVTIDLKDKTLTDLDSQNLVIKGKLDENDENALDDDSVYKVIGSVYLDDDTVEESDITFKTNSAPRLGSCSVTPEMGFAVTTEFTISCEEWEDEDLPLTYEFIYHTNKGGFVIQKGSSPKATTRLPLGNPLYGYVVGLEILIIDGLGAAFSDLLYVFVEALPAEELSGTLMGIAGGEKNPLGDLLQSGDVGKAAQMAYAVLSLVDTSEGQIGASDKKSLKDSIINQMANVKVSSLEQVSQMALVVALATEQGDEISQNSQENAVNLLEGTADFVSAQMSSGNADPEVLQGVGNSLLHGMSNVMSVASYEAQVDDEEEESDSDDTDQETEEKLDKGKSKQMAQKTLHLMDKLGSSLLGTKTVGEEPSVLKTKSLAMMLDRQVPSKIGGKKLGDGERDGGVALPSADTLFGDNAGSLPSVDSQMLAFKDNPYTWDASSKGIKSSVIDFSLKAANGSSLEVSGLSKPVELFIPQNEESGEKENTSMPVFFVKPSDGSNNMRYHQAVIPSHSALVFFEVKPEQGKSLEVYVNYKTRPTVEQYVFSAITPNIDYCNETESGLNCSSEAYVIVVSSAVTGHVGLHYIGIRYPGPEDDNSSSPGQTAQPEARRVKRGCEIHGGRQKRACVGVKDPPTTPPPTPKIIIPQYEASTDVNYTISATVTNCLYWSETRQVWTDDGCKVGPKTDPGSLHCLCTHLSAFGGDFFVAPNPIDFDKVWAEFGNLAESGNFVVLATVCSIFGLYAIALVFARKADKKDEMKVVANVYLSDNMQEGYAYEISVQTGMWRGYGTTANVGLMIYGEHGVTPTLPLSDPELNKIFFARGSINNFTLSLPESLGDLVKIKIWHDNSGKSPAWFFSQVQIIDVQTGEKWHFLGNRWLAVEKGGGQIEVEIKCAEKRELSGFKNLFYSRTASSLGDGHLWLSVFTRPPHNTFTRCQRLTCCLSILFATLITNAMFYQFDKAPTDTFQIGPIKLSWTQIKIGIQSSIIAIPVNVLVVTIFKNIKYPLPEEARFANQKVPGCLPHFFVYVGWVICILASLASALFTVFYSMMWGAETSNQWLTSIMVSFFQDVIITQPIKVILIASLLSLLIKKPPEQDSVIGSSISRNGGTNSQVAPPEGEALKRAREFQSKVLEMFRTIIEMVFFFMFIAFLMVVCYGNRKPTRFALTSELENIFSGFEKVNSPPMFWKWTRKVLVPGLYRVRWYNGDPFEYKEGFLSNREAFMVGMPRLRQSRIRPDEKCAMEVRHPDLAHQFHRCLSTYADKLAYSTSYNQPGWIPQDNSTELLSLFELQNLCPKPWRYQTAENLSTLSMQGLQSAYGGGGFVADLGYNTRSALRVLDNLEENKWINDFTAAVFVEFTIHQPATALFSVVKYLFERLPTGGYNTVAKVTTLTLYASPDSNFKSFYQLCQLLLMLIILFFLFTEIGKVYRQKCAYFTQFWNWMELFQICGAIAAIVMFFFKEMYTSLFVKRVQSNPFETSSTDYIVLWSDLEIYLLAFVIFIVTMKFLRLIRFNRHICQMTATIQKSIDHLLSFFLVFVGIILAYTQLGVLVFGANVPAYSSFFQAMRAVCQMILGGETHFHELKDTSRIVGPLYVFCYMLSMSMIMLNMFLAILNDSYEEVKDVQGDTFADAELGEFMKTYITKRAGYLAQDLVSFFKKMLSMAKLKRNPKMNDNKSYVKVPTSETDIFSHDIADEVSETCDEIPPIATIASMEDLTDSDDEAVTASLEDVRRSLSNISAELRSSFSVLDEHPPPSCDQGINDINRDMKCSCEETVLDPGSYGYNRYSSFRDIWERREDPSGRFHRPTKLIKAQPLLSDLSTDHLNVINFAISANQDNNDRFFPTIWERRGDPDDRFRTRKSSKVEPLLSDSLRDHFNETDLEGGEQIGTFARIRLEEECTPDLMSTSTINSTLGDDLPESLV
ncbi:polycystin-1-like protein 2 [Montipora foliosa]|uniref:polycystin-1-like protein 2 n=1 Tax=Montipora foliosa TaxID=591990 RepID=UPI0035F127A1